MNDARDAKQLEPDDHARPLRLSRETLRELDDLELEQVAGGKAPQSNGNTCRKTCWCSYTC